jgi:hypothetical protein
MKDLIVIVTTLAFFALCVAYVRWCDRMIGPDDVTASVEADEGVDRSVDHEVAA